MNKLPPGTPKIRFPMIVVYIPHNRDTGTFFKVLPVMAANFEEAKLITQMLLPGARIAAIRHDRDRKL